MSLETITPTQMTTEEIQAVGTRLGQEIRDLIFDRMAAENLTDLNLVMTIMVSLTAHYIAGVQPFERAMEAYTAFGKTLALAIADDRATGMCADVVDAEEHTKQ